MKRWLCSEVRIPVVVWAWVAAFILIVVFPVNAAGPEIFMSGGSAAALSYQCTDATHDGANNAITLCEDFDGVADCGDDAANAQTCRNAWTVVLGGVDDIVDLANTAAPAPLIGTRSARVTATDTAISYAHVSTASSDNLYLHARVNIDSQGAWAADANFLSIVRSTGAGVCVLGVDKTTGRWQVYTNTAIVHASLSPSVDTTYYIWLEHDRNTADTGCRAYISTTSTKPAVTIQGTSLDYAATGIRLRALETHDIVYDHIRINTSAIGSDPQ